MQAKVKSLLSFLDNFNNIKTIFKKELNSYFNSTIAYIVITVFFVLMGWLYASGIFLINYATLRNMFELAGIILLFIAPAVTMRLIAEEKKTGTIELLFTKPLHDAEIIIGKFIAAWIFILVAILLTLVYYITMIFLGEIDHGAVFGGYIGLILITGVYVAFGILASSLTENQIVAFIIGLFLCIVIYFIGETLIILPDFATGFLQFLSAKYHFSNIARGVIDTRDVIYFLSVIGLSLYLAIISLEKRKW